MTYQQKKTAQEVPVLEQPITGAALEMHMRLQRKQIKRDKELLQEYTKSFQERIQTNQTSFPYEPCGEDALEVHVEMQRAQCQRDKSILESRLSR